jgi:uncharacterized protein with beta-barrel porin domain
VPPSLRSGMWVWTKGDAMPLLADPGEPCVESCAGRRARGFAALSSSTALTTALLALGVSPAWAVCDNNNPGANTTVTCSPPVTDTTGVQGQGSTVAHVDGITVNVLAGATVNVDGSFDSAIEVFGTGAVTNAGTLSADSVPTVQFWDAATVTNEASGVINNGGFVGAVSLAFGGTIVNRGQINGNGGGFSYGVAVPGTVINHAGATIFGSYNAIWAVLGGPSTIVNHGTLSATTAGAIEMRLGGTVTNTGTIAGDLGIEVLPFNPGDQAPLAIVNSGTITGLGGTAIRFSNGANSLTLQPGGVINGNVIGTAADDSLQLGGTGMASFDLGQIGPAAQYRNFSFFNKIDGSAWTLTGTGAQTWNVNGGTLLVDGTAGGAVVNNGGALGGSGTVGLTTVNAGGAIAPGNSIGTLNIAGDVTFNAGSRYEVEIEPGGTSDLIAATGDAFLNGGTVDVVALSPITGYVDGQTFTILTANTVNGTFDGSTINSAFLTPSLIYNPGDVQLALAVTASLPDVAQTYNQRQSSTGLAGLGQTPGSDSLAVFNELLLLDAASARAAYDLASGEVHASTNHVTTGGVDLFTRTVRGQGASASVPADATGSVPLGYAPEAAPQPLPTDLLAIDTPKHETADVDARIRGAWAAPLGGGGSVLADGNAATLDWWSAGIAGGYESSIGGDTLGGIAFGYMRSGGAVAARQSTLRADSFHAGIHGAWSEGPWAASAALSYAASQITTRRRVNFGGIDRTADATYWAHSLGLSGEASYALPLGRGFRLQPFAAVDASWSGHGGAMETGAGALNLAVAAAGYGRLDTALGAALSYRSNGFTFEARAAWEHAFLNPAPAQPLSFAGSATPFQVLGATAGTDRLRLGASLGFKPTSDLSVTARYDGVFSGRERQHSGSLALKLRF